MISSRRSTTSTAVCGTRACTLVPPLERLSGWPTALGERRKTLRVALLPATYPTRMAPKCRMGHTGKTMLRAPRPFRRCRKRHRKSLVALARAEKRRPWLPEAPVEVPHQRKVSVAIEGLCQYEALRPRRNLFTTLKESGL